MSVWLAYFMILSLNDCFNLSKKETQTYRTFNDILLLCNTHQRQSQIDI